MSHHFPQRAIQFLHSARQFPFDSRDEGDGYYMLNSDEGVRLWNDDSGHYRKFMVSEGEVLGIEGPREVAFWGEWEAQSHFKLLQGNNWEFPNSVHKPYYDGKQKFVNTTDPFVFGETMFYSHCMQGTGNWIGNWLTNLDVGSLILFGANYKDKFLLDTVFVVANAYDVEEYKEYKKEFPLVFRNTGPSHLGTYRDNPHRKLYEGEMFRDKREMYSFVPGQLVEDGIIDSHERMELDWNVFDLKVPECSQGLTGIVYNDYNATQRYWDRVVEEVMDKNYEIITELKMPPMMKSNKDLEDFLKKGF